MSETLLKLTMTATGEEINFPDGSALFVEADITPIDGATDLRRTVNGSLVNLSDPAFRKLAVTLSASDMTLPALGNLYPGDTLTVECPVVIRERGGVPARPAAGGVFTIGNGWVEYRPVLECMLIANSLNETEGKASASWSLTLEEV